MQPKWEKATKSREKPQAGKVGLTILRVKYWHNHESGEYFWNCIKGDALEPNSGDLDANLNSSNRGISISRR
jgi:hypothetical protein